MKREMSRKIRSKLEISHELSFLTPIRDEKKGHRILCKEPGHRTLRDRELASSNHGILTRPLVGEGLVTPLSSTLFPLSAGTGSAPVFGLWGSEGLGSRAGEEGSGSALSCCGKWKATECWAPVEKALGCQFLWKKRFRSEAPAPSLTTHPSSFILCLGCL